jgi:hypothetical protein
VPDEAYNIRSCMLRPCGVRGVSLHTIEGVTALLLIGAHLPLLLASLLQAPINAPLKLA